MTLCFRSQFVVSCSVGDQKIGYFKMAEYLSNVKRCSLRMSALNSRPEAEYSHSISIERPVQAVQYRAVLPSSALMFTSMSAEMSLLTRDMLPLLADRIDMS